LNDRHRRLAFGPFLDAADQICGLLFTVAIHRSVQSFFKKHGKLEKTDFDSLELDGWKATTIDKASVRRSNIGSINAAFAFGSDGSSHVREAFSGMITF
jgi:hypothetical protein